VRDDLIDFDDGRQLAYTDIGDAGWPCVFLFNGAPASRLRTGYLEREFLACGIRVVSPDRPGYGGSSPQPGRTLLDWPSDVDALADRLGLDRFMVAGHSSGGPYAIVCAASLPHRVSGCITLGGVTDFAWAGAWKDYPEAEAEVMRAPDEATAVAISEERFGADGSRFMFAFKLELTGPDLELYRDPRHTKHFRAARSEGFRQGVLGYAQDAFIQGRAWAFDPRAIAAPVVIAHADPDTVVPTLHARHLVQLIPGATLRILPEHGHFSILAELPGIAAELSSAGLEED
jgi:pimeloyl-ACP methyl ester carboxylesterase